MYINSTKVAFDLYGGFQWANPRKSTRPIESLRRLHLQHCILQTAAPQYKHKYIHASRLQSLSAELRNNHLLVIGFSHITYSTCKSPVVFPVTSQTILYSYRGPVYDRMSRFRMSLRKCRALHRFLCHSLVK